MTGTGDDHKLQIKQELLRSELDGEVVGTKTEVTGKDGARLIVNSWLSGATDIELVDKNESIKIGDREVTRSDGSGFKVYNTDFNRNRYDEVQRLQNGMHTENTPSVTVNDDVSDSIMRREVQEFALRHQNDPDFMGALRKFGAHAYTHSNIEKLGFSSEFGAHAVYQDLSLEDMLKTPSHFQGAPADKPDKAIERVPVRNVILR